MHRKTPRITEDGMKKDLAALIASEMQNLSKGKKKIAETILSDIFLQKASFR